MATFQGVNVNYTSCYIQVYLLQSFLRVGFHCIAKNQHWLCPREDCIVQIITYLSQDYYIGMRVLKNRTIIIHIQYSNCYQGNIRSTIWQTRNSNIGLVITIIMRFKIGGLCCICLSTCFNLKIISSFHLSVKIPNGIHNS